MAINSVNNWTFSETTLKDIEAAEFVGSRAVILAAGPANLSDIEGSVTDLDPIAVIQEQALTQARPLIQIGEIGSNGRYFIRDRGSGTMTLSRIVFKGRSLLNVLYQNTNHYSPDDSIHTPGTQSDWPAFKNGNDWDQFWLNLDANIFEYPFGLYYALTTVKPSSAGVKHVSEYYFEGCYLDAHNISLGQGSNIIAEGCRLQWTRIKPISAFVHIPSNEP